jgi:hypothetical protein
LWLLHTVVAAFRRPRLCQHATLHQLSRLLHVVVATFRRLCLRRLTALRSLLWLLHASVAAFCLLHLRRLGALRRHLSRLLQKAGTALRRLMSWLVPEFLVALRRLYMRLPRVLVTILTQSMMLQLCLLLRMRLRNCGVCLMLRFLLILLALRDHPLIIQVHHLRYLILEHLFIWHMILLLWPLFDLSSLLFVFLLLMVLPSQTLVEALLALHHFMFLVLLMFCN